MNVLAATALTVFAVAAQTDTTLPVKPGARLNVFNFGGEVQVSSWSRNAVRIQAAHASQSRVEIRRRGPVLQVSSRGRRAPAGLVNYDIQVPRWIHLDVNGINNSVRVDGVDGDVRVETVNGAVNVRGGRGLVSARSMQGGVQVEGSRGRVHASSVNDGVVVLDTEGEVIANTVNGNIVLGRIVSDVVEAMSANGDLIWDGDFKKRGRYQFGTHNGDIVVVTKERPDATISVETFSGDFETSFPVQLREARRGHEINFSWGDGSASVGFESFQGRIQLLRAGTEKAEAAMQRQARLVERLRREIRRQQKVVEERAKRRVGDEDRDD